MVVGPDGREFTLTMVSAVTVFGEMSLIAQWLESAYAEAMEPSVVCTMRRQDLERLVIENAPVGLKVTNVLSDRLSFCEDRMEDLALKEVHTRLTGLILQLIESDGAVTHDGYKMPTRYTHW